jgi:hypothetical protein
MDHQQLCNAMARRIGEPITVDLAKEILAEAKAAQDRIDQEAAAKRCAEHAGVRKFLKISTGVEVMPLLLAIERRPQLWREDTYLRDYPQGPFGEVETIMLRFPVKTVHQTEEELANHLSRYDQHENIDYPAYRILPEARPIVMSLMSFVGGERLGRVMINKIKPGGRVFPHADTPVHADYWDRFHVVLQSSPGVRFRCGDEEVYMATSEVWWFQNAIEHEVVNNSGIDRIHMIVDIRTSQGPSA